MWKKRFSRTVMPAVDIRPPTRTGDGVAIPTFTKDVLSQNQLPTDRTPTLDRVCTAVAFIACATIAGVFVRRAWEKFSKSPIVVNVETTNYPLYKLHFPAITICPANNVKKTVGEELLARHLNMTLDSNLQQNLLSLMSALSICQYPFYFRMQAHFKPIFDMLPLFSDFNVSRFMLQVLPKCSEVFESCFWLGKEVDCCDVFHLQRTEAGFCYSFNSLTSDDTWSCAAQDEFSQHATQQEKDEYTKCQPRHNIASGTTTGFEVFLLHSNPENSLGAGQRDKNGFRVYLHHPTHFPEAGKGVFLPEQKGKAFRVEVTPSVTQSSAEVRALSIAQRQCLFPDEMRLQVFHTYTQQNCLMECRLHHVANFCGCHPYFFSAFTVASIPECNLSGLWCLSNHNVELRIFKPPPGTRGFENLTAIDCSSCLPTCHSSRYSLDYSYADDANPEAKTSGAYLDVYYKQMAAIKYHQQLAFDFMDLVVSFGGVVSLFLGVSFLGVFQLLFRFVRRCVSIRPRLHDPPALREAWNE